MYTSLSIERRIFTCEVCGQKREILTRPIEKFVLVCLHQDTRGGVLPQMQLREQGELIRD